MDTTETKKYLETQLEKAEKQIRDLEETLAKTKEFKLKLLGGLETIELLINKVDPEIQEE